MILEPVCTINTLWKPKIIARMVGVPDINSTLTVKYLAPFSGTVV